MDPIANAIIIAALLAAFGLVLWFIQRRTKASIERMREETQVMHRKLLKCRKELTAREEEIGRLGDHVSELVEENRQFQKDLHAVMKENERGVATSEESSERLQALEEQLQSREQLLNQRDEEVNQLRAGMERSRKEADSLHETVNDQIRQFEAYSSSLSRAREKLEEELARREMEALKWRERCEELEKQVPPSSRPAENSGAQSVGSPPGVAV
jgi:chromosome segregation ATPase